MSGIISQFVTALLERSEEFATAMADADINRLATLSHNLKGCAGGYGFDSISQAAALLEHETLAVEADYSSVREHVEALIELCNAAHKD
jgi:HPt (histidine-containing phosphotransfer) domain-containing protein